MYGRTKVDVEKAILDTSNAMIFRLATVFGLSSRLRSDLLVIDFVYRALKDRVVVAFEGMRAGTRFIFGMLPAHFFTLWTNSIL